MGRWRVAAGWESYEIIAEQARKLPDTRHIFVGDRESDMLALMVRAKELNHAADYRCAASTTVYCPKWTGWGKLWDGVMQSECIGGLVFELPPGRGRKPRMVRQEIRMQRVSLSDGKRTKKGQESQEDQQEQGADRSHLSDCLEIDTPQAASPWSGGC